MLGLSVGKFMFESFITLRQCRVLCKPSPPAVLSKTINQKTFLDTQKYGLAKAYFSLGRGVWFAAVQYLYLRYDILSKFWQFSGYLLLRWAPTHSASSVAQSSATLAAPYHSSIIQSSLFSVIYLLFSMLEGILPQVYYTFVVEQSFGFNKQTVAGFISDQVKTFFISSTIFATGAAGFSYIMSKAGDRFALYLGFGAFALRTLVITIYPVFILPMFYKLSPLEGKELKESIVGLTTKLSFPLTKLYVADGSSRSTHSNAIFFGLPWQKNILVFDTLIQEMEPKQVTAVIAHELGHWKHGHTAYLSALQQLDLFYSFGLFSLVYNNPHLYYTFGFKEQPAIAGFLLFCQILVPISSVHQLVNNVFSRRYEYQADAFAKSMGFGSELSTALINLNKNNLSTIDADHIYSSYHHSHPLLAERLAALQLD
ncbi:hypothetical protein PWT90_08695 [Aphanocladium album]|nr:hypothetical protein PWT90_08695 [Aphanocladium album]